MLERLHKVLARAGVAALRPAEDMIMAGRVTVNGRVVRELGARVDPDTDIIAVDGTIIDVPAPTDPRRYVILHKPVDVISTAEDTHDRPTVVDLIPSDERLFPVGRLDADSEGLILLTNDGDLANRLTHPRYEVEKEYRVLLDRTPNVADLRRWREGVELDGEMTLPVWAELLDRTDDGTWVRIVMREGRKRQIRNVAKLLGYDVLRLIRVREGPLSLGDLQPGAWRELTADEAEALRAHVRHIPAEHTEERQAPRTAQRATPRDEGRSAPRTRMGQDRPRDQAERRTPRDQDRARPAGDARRPPAPSRFGDRRGAGPGGGRSTRDTNGRRDERNDRGTGIRSGLGRFSTENTRPSGQRPRDGSRSGTERRSASTSSMRSGLPGGERRQGERRDGGTSTSSMRSGLGGGSRSGGRREGSGSTSSMRSGLGSGSRSSSTRGGPRSASGRTGGGSTSSMRGGLGGGAQNRQRGPGRAAPGRSTRPASRPTDRRTSREGAARPPRRRDDEE